MKNVNLFQIGQRVQYPKAYKVRSDYKQEIKYDYGVVVRKNADYVFVKFDGQQVEKACNPDYLI